eukprot:TRINITY_DN16345_c0_g1_i1.p1 TRINITY_DN16345_c0_g1~~TRINITY_DN16345_c0_g1_i1.p1  ORF type:complete len:322 (+),score=61.49 TRINITY_DN16345_c0_g1_i1:69-1034(+)
MAAEPGGFLSPGTPGQEGFVRDVIEFIDAPLSPKALNRLRREYRDYCGNTPPWSSGPAGSPAAAEQPADALGGAGPASAAGVQLGTWIEVCGLVNTPEFNGLTARVVGHEPGNKVLIEFLGAAGQAYDVPSHNVRRCQPPPAAPALPPLPHQHQPAAPAPEPPLRPPPRAVSAAGVPLVAELQSRLRCAMSHVESAPEALAVAQALARADPATLFATIAEFQPTLSRDNIERNWVRIVQIYQAHAERVAESSAQRDRAGPQAGTNGSWAGSSAAAFRAPQGGDDEWAAQLRGVLNFIDAPLSPRTLAGLRQLRAGQPAAPL